MLSNKVKVLLIVELVMVFLDALGNSNIEATNQLFFCPSATPFIEALRFLLRIADN